MGKDNKRGPRDMKSDKGTPSNENPEERFHFDDPGDEEIDYADERKYWEEYFDEENEHLRQKEKKKVKRKWKFRDSEF